jgi:hypothetical protein
MPFTAWQRPSLHGLQLRAMSPRIATLSVEHTRQRNRLHTAEASQAAPRCVIRDLRHALASLHRRMVKMRRAFGFGRFRGWRGASFWPLQSEPAAWSCAEPEAVHRRL